MNSGYNIYHIFVELGMSEDIRKMTTKEQKKIGAAGKMMQETSGTAENLREEAAEMTDKDQDQTEPA